MTPYFRRCFKFSTRPIDKTLLAVTKYNNYIITCFIWSRFYFLHTKKTWAKFGLLMILLNFINGWKKEMFQESIWCECSYCNCDEIHIVLVVNCQNDYHKSHICNFCGLHELSISFKHLMKCMNVFLQITSLRKWFATRFTFVIFVAFMNCVDVFLQISCLRK